MKLEAIQVDPTRLWRPSAVARRFGVDPAMITHWMDEDQLDYVITADGTRMVPEESIEALELVRSSKKPRRKAITISERVSLGE